ncbi:M15 family metallopeptidase [Psychroflexus maritimus]|uniref:M15 family metallopeptidase n=1 Tax=Psychroflexus maritimus TaxID=2714865 RepID=A0A967AG40_9FLAO|nr:M15 family metallopeptidase [Psychroflexus maritimus]NGZ89881.1 M15 family metallopeptidase [Psychroflexus maritimus]
MKRRKFNQLMLSSGIASSFFPSEVWLNNKEKFEYLLGKSNSHLVNFGNFQLEKQSLQAFLKMKEAALKDQIHIEIVSAFRSFKRQKEIFENKYKQFQTHSNSTLEIINQITTYSSIPGTSRHHWGTDIDIIQAEVDAPKNDWLEEENYLKHGAFAQLYNWMQVNAHKFGFFEAYPNNHKQRKGYLFEPWHYSYQPKAKIYLQTYLENNLIQKIKKENLVGLNELEPGFFKNYQDQFILGINQQLIP